MTFILVAFRAHPDGSEHWVWSGCGGYGKNPALNGVVMSLVILRISFGFGLAPISGLA
jgi:hypothetical protein